MVSINLVLRSNPMICPVQIHQNMLEGCSRCLDRGLQYNRDGNTISDHRECYILISVDDRAR